MIVLASLAAEGTPRLALWLSREWKRMGIRPIVIVMHTLPNDLASDFATLDIEHIDLNLREDGYGRYFALAYRIFSIARKYHPSALLSMPLGWHAFMAIGARIAGVQSIVAHVGNCPDSSAGRTLSKFRLLVQLGRPFTNSLICCSHYVRNGAISRLGVSNKETEVIYNGLPLGAFVKRQIQREAHSAAEPFIVGMVARLEQHKDQPTLIRAARILKQRGRNIRVWLIGEGSRRRELEFLINSEGVGDVVDLLGMRKNIAELIGKMDLFAFSTSADEGLGIALLEAIATGVPVIASDVGACREVLDDGALGQLVPAANPRELADAIDAALLRPDAAKQRAEKAYRKALRTFSIEDMALRYAILLNIAPSPQDSHSTTVAYSFT
ncbi:MAG TPA: glycosyltransferase [Hyphomicrobium sp.]|nr:glycosyltransferase [Rhizomicrobium sp.]HVX35779.1 glycosyltransferase [Hyphomicrobium sp.]